MMDEVPKKKIVSVIFSQALYCLLFTHDSLVMAGLGLACLVQLRLTGLAWSASVFHSRMSYDLTCRCQIYGESVILHFE